MIYKKILNPKFEKLSSFIDRLPEVFESSGETIYTGRNLIKVFDVDGFKVNVKRYGIPFVLNRLVYRFIRKPKGLRAYEYPFILADKGIPTPEPIAYLEQRVNGLIHYSYFVSVQSSYQSQLYEIGNLEATDIPKLILSLAQFTAKLHKQEVYHKDYSPGNILLHKNEEDTYDFCLVDINRMRFGPVSIKEGCENFARLWGQPSTFKALALEYARLRNADPNQCVAWTMQARNKFWKRQAKKRGVKYNLKFE